jgi:hypothetical protein
MRGIGVMGRRITSTGLAVAVGAGVALGGSSLLGGAPAASAGPVQVTAAQLLTNQRIAQAALRRTNALRGYLMRPQTISIPAVSMVSRASASCPEGSTFCAPSPGVEASPSPGIPGGVLGDARGSYFAAVALPVGAVIRKFDLVAFDNEFADTFDVEATLYRVKDQPPNPIAVATAGTGGAKATGYQVVTGHLSRLTKVEPGMAYYVELKLPHGVGLPGATPPPFGQFNPVMVRVTYTMPVPS